MKYPIYEQDVIELNSFIITNFQLIIKCHIDFLSSAKIEMTKQELEKLAYEICDKYKIPFSLLKALCEGKNENN